MLDVEQSSEKHPLRFAVWLPENVEGHVYRRDSAAVGSQVVTFLGYSYTDTQVTLTLSQVNLYKENCAWF